MENIKLVIWDLDETFWKGTLSEGKVEIIDQNVSIVKELTDRGIICSISSKNNFEEVKKVLSDIGIWELFVFPKITWEPKGEQIKSLLKQCSLRPANTLFIDDNISNIKEVEFYNPGIITSLPDILYNRFLDIPELKGKPDIDHSRLKQYKILEERNKIEQSYSSNEDFLRASHIKISINYDCSKNIARINELIQRTNQLNYTKIRSSETDTNALINDLSAKCATISVCDDFGEYGIIGFFALKNNQLIHFVFSCRTIGFGIENYIYKKLGYPEVIIQGDVSSELSKEYADSIDWIEEIEHINNTNLIKKDNYRKILMIGGCDLDQTCTYIESQIQIDKEFNTIIDGREIRTSDLSQLVNSYRLDEAVKNELCENIPFFHKDITFKTKLFDNQYDIIIISVIDDYIRGIWKNIKNGYEIGYGGFFDQEYMLSRFSDSELNYLKANFEYTGKEDKEIFEKYLREIICKINNETKIILINGVDLDISDYIGKERVERNIEMNSIVDRVANDYKNVEIIDIRKIVVDRSQLPQNDNRHLDRKSYYQIAEKILEYCEEYYGNKNIKIKSINSIRIKNLINKVNKKIRKCLRLDK